MNIAQCERRTKVMRFLRKMKRLHLLPISAYDRITDRLFDNY